jgi:four helix bundle protein
VSHSYKDLFVWQKARALAVLIYQVTERYPKSEVYGLTAQSRRAAISVVSNIAEGQGRLTKGEFRQFLGQARGSLLELDAQLAISSDLGYLQSEQYASLGREITNTLGLINRLIDSLRQSISRTSKP